jgi:hypothetical protein
VSVALLVEGPPHLGRCTERYVFASLCGILRSVQCRKFDSAAVVLSKHFDRMLQFRRYGREVIHDLMQKMMVV